MRATRADRADLRVAPTVAFTNPSLRAWQRPCAATPGHDAVTPDRSMKETGHA
ncbi:hypothetical protein [Paracoccus luteus]|uniref:hypothetical protein n=1 Tax=Paracoccus luteus TaxID=2508543 RepID=UPI00143008A3|nr:hypothetical protein [Paracoccus luteus]